LQDPKILADLESRSNNQPDKTVTVCYGLDFVNVSYSNFVASDEKIAKEWIAGLRQITHNVKANNICPMTSLKKQ
jgi:phosphatidylinositol phospholipase C beta